MSLFQIQDTKSRPTSGISTSGQAPFVQDLSHHHCKTMESPPIPSYVRGGPQPADDIVQLSREISMENLRELQKYAERLQLEATCVRLWSNGIQDQIMDETEKVQNWISGMIGELNRLRRVQPAWVHELQAQANQQPPSSMVPCSASAAAQASSSSASSVPAKAAPASKHPSMASTPRNAPFPNVQGTDLWAGHKPRSQ